MAFNKKKNTQNRLIEALEKSLGVVTTACKSIGINRDFYYKYYNEDEDFKKRVDKIENTSLDFVESQLYQKIKGIPKLDINKKIIGYVCEPDTACIIWYMKCKGKKRGYSEPSKIDITSNGESLSFAPINFLKPDED